MAEQKKIGAMISGGKDSLYAAYLMQKENLLECVIIMYSRNQASYMFHTPNINMAKLQAECMELPVIEGTTKGEKEDELEDLQETIKRAKEKYQLDGIVTGALFSNYQKERVERVCNDLGLEAFSPLWHMDQKKEMRDLINEGFSFILSSVACYGLNKQWLGKIIAGEDIDKLVELNKKYRINIAGEGGEFESLVLDCRLFNKAITITDWGVHEEDENTAFFMVKQAKTYKK